jgi:predicted ATP-grasp superfamily ATP-dependent carboligase
LREKAESRAAFVVEDWGKVSVLADKWTSYRLAQELGIPAPRTALPETPELDELRFPVVAKPRIAESSHGVEFLATQRELDGFLAGLPQIGHVPSEGSAYVVQEMVEGRIHGASACAHRGVAVSLHTTARLLTRYEFGGVGLVHELTVEPDLMEYARRVLAHLEWSGPANLEFIRDEQGRPFLIEVNPRVWGSTELTVAAGLNVPQQALEIAALGRCPEPVEDYLAGYRARWLTAGSVLACFRAPRGAAAVAERCEMLLGPRGDARPSRTSGRGTSATSPG